MRVILALMLAIFAVPTAAPAACHDAAPAVTSHHAMPMPGDGHPRAIPAHGCIGCIGCIPPSDWLADERWPIPVLADDAQSSAANAAGLNAFPFYVATDGAGKVVARSSGELTIPQIEAMVAKARAGAA